MQAAFSGMLDKLALIMAHSPSSGGVRAGARRQVLAGLAKLLRMRMSRSNISALFSAWGAPSCCACG